jgi:hypothetical protein
VECKRPGHPPVIGKSYIPWGGARNYNNNANNYFIVLVPCK